MMDWQTWLSGPKYLYDEETFLIVLIEMQDRGLTVFYERGRLKVKDGYGHLHVDIESRIASAEVEGFTKRFFEEENEKEPTRIAYLTQKLEDLRARRRTERTEGLPHPLFSKAKWEQEVREIEEHLSRSDERTELRYRRIELTTPLAELYGEMRPALEQLGYRFI